MKHFFVTNLEISNNAINFDTVCVFLQNVCGVHGKREELDLYLEAETSHKPHYVCLTEHFLNCENVLLFNLTNYKLVSHNSRKNMKRGGSLILGISGRHCTELNICKKLYSREYFEICGIRDVESDLNIFCIYRNHKIKYYDEFMEKIENLLNQFFNKKCLICGDFNIDLLVDDHYRNNFLNLLRCYNFRPLFNSATFSRGSASSCLDNILTNVAEPQIVQTIVDDNGLSDGHACLLCETNFVTHKKNKPIMNIALTWKVECTTNKIKRLLDNI